MWVGYFITSTRIIIYIRIVHECQGWIDKSLRRASWCQTVTWGTDLSIRTLLYLIIVFSLDIKSCWRKVVTTLTCGNISCPLLVVNKVKSAKKMLQRLRYISINCNKFRAKLLQQNENLVSLGQNISLTAVFAQSSSCSSNIQHIVLSCRQLDLLLRFERAYSVYLRASLFNPW